METAHLSISVQAYASLQRLMPITSSHLISLYSWLIRCSRLKIRMFVLALLHLRDPSSQIPFETWISAPNQQSSSVDRSSDSALSRPFPNGMFLFPLQSPLPAALHRVGRRLSRWFNTRISTLILFTCQARAQIARSLFVAGELLFLNRSYRF